MPSKIIFQDYEFKIYKNCLDLDFLAELQKNVYRNLLKLTTLDNHFVCRLINNEYNYEHRDWLNGFYQKYNLSYCVDFYEQKKLTCLKTINVKF